MCGVSPEKLFLCFSMHAKIMVTNQLSMIKFKRNNQYKFVVDHGCHSDAHNFEFSSINFLNFNTYLVSHSLLKWFHIC